MFPACPQQCPKSVPQVFPKCFTHVPNVYHMCPNCCRAYLKCVSNASQTCSQRVPNSVLQMLQTRFKSVLFLFQACSNDVSVSNVCEWWFSNFLKRAQSVPTVPNLSHKCCKRVWTRVKSISKCSHGVSNVFQQCPRRAPNVSTTVSNSPPQVS